MKANYSTEHPMRGRLLNKYKTLSTDIIEKIKNKALNRPPRTFSKEQLASMKKSSKSVVLYNKNATVHGEFNSIVDASKSVNCNEKTIIRALKYKSKWLKTT